MCNNGRYVYFKHPKNKFNKVVADTKVEVPDDVKSDSILNALIEMRVRDCKSISPSTISYLITHRHAPVFSEFLKPIEACELSDLITLRARYHELVRLNKFPKSYSRALSTGLSKIELKLRCGRRIRDWGRYKSIDQNNPRQVQKDDYLWNTIKDIDDIKEAKKAAKNEVDDINDRYFTAAWHHITNYLSLLKETQSWSDGGYSESALEAKFKRIKRRLGFSAAFTGHRRNYLDEEWRGHLSPRLLISILVICKLRRPLNTDVWTSLRKENFKVERASITISGGIKHKTNSEVPSFRVLNRDREFFIALNLLHQHIHTMERLIDEHGVETLRQPFAFDYFVTRQRFRLPVDHQFLLGNGFKRFCTDNSLPYLTLDTLRNLSATKKFLDGQDIRDIQRLLGHANLNTTKHYLEQHVVSTYLSHNILIFMRQFESEAVYEFDDKGMFSNAVTIESPTTSYFLLGDGSTCSDPYKSPDSKQEAGELCNGKLCHAGCSNNKIILNSSSIWQALVKREEYRTTWYQRAFHGEKFAAFEAKKILFNALLCQHIAIQKPDLYDSMMMKINNKIKSMDV